MKTVLRLFPVLATLWVLSACSSVPRSATDSAWLQKALDTVLPPTFTGYIKASHHNDYFTLDFEGDGLRRTDQGWKWDWLAYNRRSHLPLFSGWNLSSTGQVLLGKPPAAVSAVTPGPVSP